MTGPWRRRLRLTGIVVAAWTVPAVVSGSLAVALFPQAAAETSALKLMLYYAVPWYFWALMTPVAWWISGALNVGRWGLARIIAGHLVMAVVMALAHVGVLVATSYVLFPPQGESIRQMASGFLASRFVIGLMIYAALAGLRYTLEYYRLYRERALRTSQLEARLSQAQLHALKMQLHPHFLFNTLHAIAVLIKEDPIAATTTLVLLSDLLRVTLANPGVHEVALEEELETLKLYLEIERIRFADRLRVSFDVPPETLQAAVPNLILQPLAENALRHGIERLGGSGRLAVAAAQGDGELVLSVEDDGPGFPEGGPREGIGLSNTRARLEMLYGAGSRLAWENLPGGGARVTLHLPFAATDADPRLPEES